MNGDFSSTELCFNRVLHLPRAQGEGVPCSSSKRVALVLLGLLLPYWYCYQYWQPIYLHTLVGDNMLRQLLGH